MCKMRMWYETNNIHKNVLDALGIKYIKSDKVVVCILDNKPIEDAINGFVTNMVFQHVDLYWIIE